MSESRQVRRARERFEAKHPPQPVAETKPKDAAQWQEPTERRRAGIPRVAIAMAALSLIGGRP